jgi:hypothetical protein
MSAPIPGSSHDTLASPPPPPVDLPDLTPMSHMDLDDVLDSSFLQPSTASRSNSSEGEGGDDDAADAADQSPSDSVVAPPPGSRAFDDLSRWSRIPIGAYRRSTTNNASISDRAYPPALRRVANAEGSFYLPLGTGRFKGGRSKKSSNFGSILPVSPVLFPSRSASHGQHSSGLVPIASKAKRAKRKQKKTPSKTKPKATKSSPPQKGRITPRALAALQGDHPASGVPFPPPPPPSDDFFYSNPHLPDLPAPSLPSAGCPPFGSPLFSGVGHSESIPSFSFDG